MDEMRVIEVQAADTIEEADARADMLRLAHYGAETTIERGWSWITSRTGIIEVNARYAVIDKKPPAPKVLGMYKVQPDGSWNPVEPTVPIPDAVMEQLLQAQMPDEEA
jgi:hypothetical protein